MTASLSAVAEQTVVLVLAGRHWLWVWEFILWVLVIALYFVFSNHQGFGTELLITVFFALFFDLVLGYVGIVTFGYAAFFGVGAYMVGMLAKHGIWNESVTGLILAVVVAAVVGLGLGVVLLCTHGLTLLMLIFCIMILFEEVANLVHDYIGGFDGLDSLAIRLLLGVFEFNPLYSRTQYLYVFIVLIFCFAFVCTLVYLLFGQSFRGIRENVLWMHAVGVPVWVRLVICYGFSVVIVGVVGGIWVQANVYVNLGIFGFERAAIVLIILVFGGVGCLYGVFVGVVAYMVFVYFLAKVYLTVWQLGLGFLLMVIALFVCNGVLGLGDVVWSIVGRVSAQIA